MNGRPHGLRAIALTIQKQHWAMILVCWCATSANAGPYWPNDAVSAFIETMVREEGFKRNELIDVFDNVQRETRSLPLIKRAPEKKATSKADAWVNYQNRFLTSFHIDKGREFLREHAKWLSLAEKRYGVPAPIIAAILGVETNYGTYTGKFLAINVLTTLAFEHPRRRTFYTRELKEFLV